ncbi:MAG: tetratricopeptide repeat protein [Armatimonadetes bacterium]|nr:tetratricopeptide repeat protein [Armatimonadota bacterium]
MDDNSPLRAVIDSARAAIRSKDYQQAYQLLQEHQADGWDEGLFLEMFGIACCMAGKSREGLPALERALDLAPSPVAHFNLGQAHQLAGDYDQAKECFKHAIGLDPTYGQAIHALERLRDFEREKEALEAAAAEQQMQGLHGGPPIGGPPTRSPQPGA